MREPGRASRAIENALALAGMVPAFLYGIAESAARIGLHFGDHQEDHGMPWGIIVILAICVAPKTVGKATSGKIWSVLAARFGGARVDTAVSRDVPPPRPFARSDPPPPPLPGHGEQDHRERDDDERGD